MKEGQIRLTGMEDAGGISTWNMDLGADHSSLQIITTHQPPPHCPASVSKPWARPATSSISQSLRCHQWRSQAWESPFQKMLPLTKPSFFIARMKISGCISTRGEDLHHTSFQNWTKGWRGHILSISLSKAQGRVAQPAPHLSIPEHGCHTSLQ